MDEVNFMDTFSPQAMERGRDIDSDSDTSMNKSATSMVSLLDSKKKGNRSKIIPFNLFEIGRDIGPAAAK